MSEKESGLVAANEVSLPFFSTDLSEGKMKFCMSLSKKC